ncbi:hypothetical protein Cgig2_005907 [Carnegiea gigantea]|uniref:CCHC-type domain-containing protein n=1 Tax=Carnegiea gigantea TaxID=171969 RepID=A0A9Q1JZZ6_9CARY|nr:hypothetical protein Cgig2_005907 [Carnegiea gigantea]
MEMHDSVTVDNATGLVKGGEALDNGYNRRILPPLKPRLQGRPRKRRGISKARHPGLECLKCEEVGHYKNTCRNPRVDFNADEAIVVVHVEDLFEGSYVRRHNMKENCERNPELVRGFSSSNQSMPPNNYQVMGWGTHITLTCHDGGSDRNK